MVYHKGSHCNNNCAHAVFESETTAVGYQFGEAVEFDTNVIYCNKDSSAKYYPSRPRYNCPIYQAVEQCLHPTSETLPDLQVLSTPEHSAKSQSES